MKISILLPYKENFSPDYPGAVSLFINDTLNESKYRKKIVVFGNTKFSKIFNVYNSKKVNNEWIFNKWFSYFFVSNYSCGSYTKY